MSTEGERLARIEMKIEAIGEKVEDALELKPRVESLEETRSFVRTLWFGVKWVGGMMLLTFTSSLMIGEKLAKWWGLIK